ncbi:hypothetical protein [Pelobium manganitolerans]|uniref:hypothetical protein n=1 Tax=Pelobium manganitolerans TaxID=1842495 RepID=UPI003FA36E39
MKKSLLYVFFQDKSSFIRVLPLVLFLVVAYALSAHAQGSVGIGTATPNASAALDVVSTSKGMLVPRLTVAQRNAIASPANGLLIYNSDASKFNYWDGAKWAEVGEGLTWFTGQGVPANMGKVNDLYLDEASGDIYQRNYDSLNPLVLVWNRFSFNKNNKKQVAVSGATVAANGFSTQSFTFPGVGSSNAVLCSPAFDLPNGLVISHAWVSGANEVSVKFYNSTAAPISISGNFQLAIF